MLAVTTALCADQVVASAPSLRPQVGTLAGRIVDRLTQSFGRTVAAVAQVQPRDRAMTVRVEADCLVVPVAPFSIVHQELSPFEFRLPPPAL